MCGGWLWLVGKETKKNCFDKDLEIIAESLLMSYTLTN